MFPNTMTNENNQYFETEIRFNEPYILGNEQNETEYSSLSLDYFNSEKNIGQFCNLELNMTFDKAFTKIFQPVELQEGKKVKIFNVVQRPRETKSVFTNVENEESKSCISDEKFLKRKRAGILKEKSRINRISK